MTEDIINQKCLNIKCELNHLDQLREKRKKIIQSNLALPDKILNLLENCKTHGTLPFSNLARCSFISIAFLKSLLLQSALTASGIPPTK